MQATIDRIRAIFQLEQKALTAYRAEDPAAYNRLLEQLHGHSAAPRINFGMEPRSGPLDDFERMMYTTLPAAPTVRHLYKVSRYAPEGEVVYLAYVSPKNPPADQFALADCFTFQERGDKLLAEALHQFDSLNRPDYEWKYTAGNKQFGPETMGSPAEILRLHSPSSPAAATADYLADK